MYLVSSDIWQFFLSFEKLLSIGAVSTRGWHNCPNKRTFEFLEDSPIPRQFGWRGHATDDRYQHHSE